MNLELQNPFAQDFPENFETSIDAAAVCTRFNPRGVFAGHFLAVGRLDGVVAILDFETKGIVRWLEGHVKAVTTVCWSRYSRHLLTASRDWNCIIWDLSSSPSSTSTEERRNTVRFDAPVTSAHLHPRNSKILCVTLHSQVEPVLIDLRLECGGRWLLEIPLEEADEVETEAEGEGGEEEEDEEEDQEYAKRNREIATTCRFNPRGNLVYVGTSKGSIHVWSVTTRRLLWTEYTGANSTIKHMEFDSKGTSLVINSNDRCIRVIELHPSGVPKPSSGQSPGATPNPHDEKESAANSMIADGEVEEEEDTEQEEEEEPPRDPIVPVFKVVHRFQDLVNRTPWHSCGFSKDGEYIVGGAGHKAAHNIYIWDRETGGLLKILEGPKDPLEDLDWHPIRPLIASVSSLGLIHLWVTGITENWSAYAPGFEELDENMDYQEKEDEFDIEDESITKRRKADEQDRPVDICTLSSARSISPLLHLPHHDSAALAHTNDDHPTLQRSLADYEHFILQEPDDDVDEAFYPPPELDSYYEPDAEVPPQNLNGHGNVEDNGTVSDDLAIANIVVEGGEPRKKKKSKK